MSKTPNANGTKRVFLHTLLKLGQLRERGNEVEDERFDVRWSHHGQEQFEFSNRFEIDVKIGSCSVSVQLITNEVRNEQSGH